MQRGTERPLVISFTTSAERDAFALALSEYGDPNVVWSIVA